MLHFAGPPPRRVHAYCPTTSAAPALAAAEVGTAWPAGWGPGMRVRASMEQGGCGSGWVLSIGASQPPHVRTCRQPGVQVCSVLAWYV